MPVVHRDAKKRARQSKRKALQNQAIKSRLKTEAKKFLSAVTAGDKDLALSLFKSTTRLFDRAASKGVVHRNLAARKKSRLRLKLNAVGTAVAKPTKRSAA